MRFFTCHHSDITYFAMMLARQASLVFTTVEPTRSLTPGLMLSAAMNVSSLLPDSTSPAKQQNGQGLDSSSTEGLSEGEKAGIAIAAILFALIPGTFILSYFIIRWRSRRLQEMNGGPPPNPNGQIDMSRMSTRDMDDHGESMIESRSIAPSMMMDHDKELSRPYDPTDYLNLHHRHEQGDEEDEQQPPQQPPQQQKQQQELAQQAQGGARDDAEDLDLPPPPPPHSPTKDLAMQSPVEIDSNPPRFAELPGDNHSYSTTDGHDGMDEHDHIITRDHSVRYPVKYSASRSTEYSTAQSIQYSTAPSVEYLTGTVIEYTTAPPGEYAAPQTAEYSTTQPVEYTNTTPPNYLSGKPDDHTTVTATEITTTDLIECSLGYTGSIQQREHLATRSLENLLDRFHSHAPTQPATRSLENLLDSIQNNPANQPASLRSIEGFSAQALPAFDSQIEEPSADELNRLREQYAYLEARRQTILQLQHINDEQAAIRDRITELEYWPPEDAPPANSF
jgi:hypothetical protein